MLLYILFVAATLLLHSQATSCPGSVKYTLTFQAEWTAKAHPEDFPSDHRPHFSPLVGCSHNAGYVMWKPGQNATKGVKDVAEKGTTSTLNEEMKKAMEEKKVLHRFKTRANTDNTGTATVKNIEVNTANHLVSAITMIAPSPDWFIGVHDCNLCNERNGTWFDRKVEDLFLYDSGTDDAQTFVHNNTPSRPAVPIFRITNKYEGSLKSNNTIKRFGTFTFTNGANVITYCYIIYNTVMLPRIILAVATFLNIAV